MMIMLVVLLQWATSLVFPSKSVAMGSLPVSTQSVCFLYHLVTIAFSQIVRFHLCTSFETIVCVCEFACVQGGAEKTGPPSHCKYSEIPWPNCMEIGELLQYYMLNTVINFLFKNFIALWRHLAKTQLLSFIHIVQIDLSITQTVFSI